MADFVTVTIDRDECIACASCWETCPEVYEEGEDTLSQIVEEYRTNGDLAAGQVPKDLEDCAQEGADFCPVEVIHVEAG